MKRSVERSGDRSERDLAKRMGIHTGGVNGSSETGKNDGSLRIDEGRDIPNATHNAQDAKEMGHEELGRRDSSTICR